MPQGTIRATVLIETILAAFEMEEILYELRDHSAGLNCGRWDYIFSCHQEVPQPPGLRAGRPRAGHDDHPLHATPTRCWRSRPATGAAPTRSAAWRPRSRSRTTPSPTRRRSPRCAPTRSARPATATTAPGSRTRAWCRSPSRPSTRSCPARTRSTACARTSTITAKDLLTFVPEGPITEAGLRINISVGVQYLGAWLNGNGCVPDQQPDGGRRHRRDLAQPGVAVDPQRQGRPGRRPQGGRRALPRRSSPRSWTRSTRQYPENLHSYFDRAAVLFDQISTSDDFVEFLTLPAYDMID